MSAALLVTAYVFGCLYFFRYAMRIPREKKRAPAPEKPLTDAEKSARDFWLGTRRWLASLPGKEEWTARTDDRKTLRATFVPNGNSDACALLVHGWHGRHDDMAAYGQKLYEERSCAMLLPQQRGHGQSDGKYTTMGYRESRDMLLWIDQLIARGYKKIIVLGVSMGAGTVMMLSSLDMPGEVKCLVEDCGYTSVSEEFTHASGDMLGKMRFAAPLLVAGGNLISRLFLGFSYRDVICERAVAGAKRPMLFIHGESDTFVPYPMLKRNYDACTAEKRLLSIPGAAHAASLATDRGRYEAALLSFVDTYFNK